MDNARESLEEMKKTVGKFQPISIKIKELMKRIGATTEEVVEMSQASRLLNAKENKTLKNILVQVIKIQENFMVKEKIFLNYFEELTNRIRTGLLIELDEQGNQESRAQTFEDFRMELERFEEEIEEKENMLEELKRRLAEER